LVRGPYYRSPLGGYCPFTHLKLQEIEMDQDRSDSAAPGDPGTPGNDADRRLMLVLAHILAVVATFALWAAADAWQSATGIAAASVLSVLAAIPAGVVFATLVHEWGHFAGARVSGARYTVPRKVGLYAFDYDFSANSIPQFFSMSWGGQIGGAVAIALLWAALPQDTAGRCMVLASAIGAFFFAGMIEWPVLMRTRTSGNPLAELSRINRDTLYRSGRTGLGAMLVAWLVLAF
jgi:hypothetical protein